MLSASLNPFLKISLLADQLSLTAVQHLRLVHFVIEFLLLLAVVVDQQFVDILVASGLGCLLFVYGVIDVLDY